MLLNEIKDHPQIDNVEQLIQFIKAQCKPFLLQVEDLPLLRGMTHRPDFIYHQHERRNPRNSSLMIHDLYNKAFSEIYNVAYRNGIFCSGSYWQAAAYNAFPSMIFPINDFTFCWSATIKDLWNGDGIYYPAYKTDRGYYDEEKLGLKIKEKVKNEFVTNNLAGAIKTGNEIMLNCPNGYIAINTTNLKPLESNAEEIWRELIS